jgi:hypothetical protein
MSDDLYDSTRQARCSSSETAWKAIFQYSQYWHANALDRKSGTLPDSASGLPARQTALEFIVAAVYQSRRNR